MSSKKSKTITRLACNCGQVRVDVQEEPILVTECLCSSCREAAERIISSLRVKSYLTSYGATGCAEYRKDRVEVISGFEQLKEFRLSSKSGTRRVIASCCNTPIFLEMKGAHWLSVYLHLWPDDTKPALNVRTMVGDIDDTSALPDDVPNLKSHTPSFYIKLLGAWIKMGFQNPKIKVNGSIEL
ncbi:DUF6151 family protein [Colwellia sp. E2M01]|uniref:GFA family protein n=1 Tax=Colwellia sp. E2M01 TaxID=2841561 RepID=UPI001C0861F0|nr:DUF6151 family protein [Colwellia sp. E2M01]MBU2871355.1 hypothetical protein [Colwellia sp. E2M01]